MAPEYNKKKNDELQDLLKARSLPHTGKKADLISRLQQYDKEHASSTPGAAADDEIDWDDDNNSAATPATVPAATPATATAASASIDPSVTTALAAGGKGSVANPIAVPNQVQAEDPTTAHDLTVAEAPAATPAAAGETKPADPASADVEKETTTAPVPPTASLPSTSLDSELAKRKARAARFGLAESSDDALKALERAKRFGTGGKEDREGVKGLDEALPERNGRGGRKRGREEGEGDGNEGRGRGRRRVGGRERVGRGGGGGGEGRQTRQGGAQGKGNREKEGWSAKDAAAAEARKKRFATG